MGVPGPIPEETRISEIDWDVTLTISMAKPGVYRRYGSESFLRFEGFK